MTTYVKSLDGKQKWTHHTWYPIPFSLLIVKNVWDLHN